MDYQPKTEPFPHQLEIFEATRDLAGHALFLEQGTGKSKIAIDTAAWLYEKGEIDTVITLAPKAVAPNWTYDEIPTHLPDRVAESTLSFLWRTERAKTKAYQASLPDVLAHTGLLWVSMSYDALMTENRKGARPLKGLRRNFKGYEFTKELLKRRVMLIMDESARIKNPGAKRSKRVFAASKHALFTRLLTGTPVSNSPFDVFSQLRCLDAEVWDRRGCASFAAFKAVYGDWVENIRRDTGQRFKTLISYTNLADLHSIVDAMGSRRLLTEVMDLPDRIYQKRRFDLTTKQWSAYRALRDECMVLLDSGELITAPLAITRLLRFQQLTSNYLVDDEGGVVQIEDENPRLKCLRDVLEGVSGSAIVWAKFQKDIDQIAELCAAMEVTAVTYDGRTSAADREVARNSLQDRSARIFIGNPAAAGEGLTLHAATTVIYYNTSFRLSDRLQSEARAFRIGQKFPVIYIDIIANDTVDEHVVRALREKVEVASIVTGDKLRQWI